MTALLITVHVTVCTLLIIIILIQRGRGGGLAESFSGVESMFGTKTDAFLSRTTTVLSTIFFITCLSLAVLSVKQGKSLMKEIKPQTAPLEQTAPETSPDKSAKQTPQPVPKAEEKATPAPIEEAPKAE